MQACRLLLAVQLPQPIETSSESDKEKYRVCEDRYLELRNKATPIVARQRHSSTSNAPLLFQSEFTKFTSPNMKGYSDSGFE